MLNFIYGEDVRVVPTQGGYQKPKAGKVLKVTTTQVVVSFDGKPYGMTFRRKDGLPAFKADQGFPLYRVEPLPTSSSPPDAIVSQVKWQKIKAVGLPPEHLHFIGHDRVPRTFLCRSERSLFTSVMNADGSGFADEGEEPTLSWTIVVGF